MRPANVEHIRAGTFRPERHGKLLAGEDLPVKPLHRDATPAMSRVWGRMRELQFEYRDVKSVEVRHDVALAFSRLANDYLDAAARSRRDPLKEIDGLAEIIAINRYARELYEREQAKRRRTS